MIWFTLPDAQRFHAAKGESKSPPCRTKREQGWGDGHPICFADRLSFHKLSKHFFRVDGDEDAAAAGQDFSLLVEDLGGIDVLAAVDAHFPALDVKRFV